MLARNRTWIRQVSSLFLHNGGNVVVFAVGAVYDRATFVSGWANCAVIDRSYSGVGSELLCCAKPGESAAGTT